MIVVIAMLAPPPTRPFASTKSLHLRAYRELDSAQLFNMYNDERVTRSMSLDYAVPYGENQWKPCLDQVTAGLIHLIAEVKPDCEDGNAVNMSDEERWVGHVNLNVRGQKN